MGRDLLENEVEASKNSLDKFLQVKKKQNFLPFSSFTLYVFFQWNFSWSIGQCFVLLSQIPYKKSEEFPWLVYLKFSLVYSYLHPLFA